MLNIAQIGVGYWGPNLLRNIYNNSRCKINKIVEIDDSRIKYINKNFPKILVQKNLEFILNDNNIDAVVISTPVNTHYKLSLECLKAGKHILVEKPLATSLKEIQDLKEISSDNNLTVMTGHTFIYNSAVQYIKKIINNGDLGDIIYIFSQRLNLGRIRSDVNAIWNFAPHDISIIQYWMNEINYKNINYTGKSYIKKNIDDVGFLNILYENNVLANIHVSWINPFKVRKMTIIGTKKMLEYDDLSKNKVAIINKGIDINHNLTENMDFDTNKIISHGSKSVSYPKISFIEPLKVQIDHFVDCILFGKKSLTNIDHAATVVKILEETNV